MSPATLEIRIDPNDPHRAKLYLGAGHWLSLVREHERWQATPYRMAMLGGALAVPKDEAPEHGGQSWPAL